MPAFTSLARTIPLLLCLAGCGGTEHGVQSASASASSPEARSPSIEPHQERSAVVIYQLLPRLFGNTSQTQRPWGTALENGLGRFADITPAALQGIAELGVSHVWYTGVLHHALVADYRAYGIDDDDPDVVKGRAGSPYAIKDYYNVNPDLALDPAQRLEEFRALVQRSHAESLRVIIDIVPNHVARNYRSLHTQQGIVDFGSNDDTTVEYARDNSFYYIVDSAFEVPEWPPGYQVLGGESHPLADGQYAEFPARWTGNDVRKAQPDFDDWFETVKLNFGLRPDGTRDFPVLPAALRGADAAAHAAFWSDIDVPQTWRQFRDIVDFWLDFGIDGFRYDMAEMVPVEFWSYLNSHIRSRRADALLIAEIYTPAMYRDYLELGLMDLLYDKVDLYDGLKAIVQGRADTDSIEVIRTRLEDIEPQLLRFAENHDEQRIASPAFAGDAAAGQPLTLISATLGRNATLIYFGQEVGEAAEQDTGFGKATRTTIFDYWGVPAHQRWMNEGSFDAGRLTEAEQSLRSFYRRLGQLLQSSPALDGHFHALHEANRSVDSPDYDGRLYSYARSDSHQQLILLSSFDRERHRVVELMIPWEVIAEWGLGDGEYPLRERLADLPDAVLKVSAGVGHVQLDLPPLVARALELEHRQ